MADELERLLDSYSAGADTSRLEDAARIRQRGRRRSLLAVASVATVVAAVTVAATAVASTRPVVLPPGGNLSNSAPAATSGGCPSLDDETQHVAIRLVDFVRANGQTYSAEPGTGSATPPALGAIQFTVQCSFRELNNRTGKMPPPARDGDAAFLPAGTPVYRVLGWSASCGLAAQHDGAWHVYVGDYVDCPDRPTASPSSTQASQSPGHPTPAPSSPVTDVPVTVTLWHCGVTDLHVSGMRWVAIHPPFDGTNAPSTFSGHGTVSTIGATLVYTDDGGATITFDHDESYQAPVCS